MSSRQPLRGGVIPFNMAPPTSSNTQGPLHGTSPLVGPATAPYRPNGQGRVRHDNDNPLVRSVVRASTAISEAVATSDDASNKARQAQRERHIAQLNLADTQYAASALVDLHRDPRLKRQIEPASDERDIEMSSSEPLATAAPAFITGKRVTALANEGITFGNGRRQTSNVHAQADQVNPHQARDRQLTDHIRLLEGRLEEVSTALEECEIGMESALDRLQLENELWEWISCVVDYIDAPKRRIESRIRDGFRRQRELRERAVRVTGPVRCTRQLKRMGEQTHYRRRSRSPERERIPYAPAPAHQHPLAVPVLQKCAIQAATSAQGCSVQATPPTTQSSQVQQHDCREEVMHDLPVSSQLLDHGVEATVPPPMTAEAARRKHIQFVKNLFYRDAVMVGSDYEKEYRRDLIRSEFPKRSPSVSTDVPMLDVVSVTGDVASVTGNITTISDVCSDVSMEDVSRGSNSCGVNFAINCDGTAAAVQQAPTTNLQPTKSQLSDIDWTFVVPEYPCGSKRTYKMLFVDPLRTLADPDHPYRSVGIRMKRAKCVKVNETTGSTEPELNATAPTETVLEVPVVSASAPCEPAPTQHVPTDKVPTEAAVSAPAVSEPAPAVEESTESGLTLEVSYLPVRIDVAHLLTRHTLPSVNFSWWAALNAMVTSAPSEPALAVAELTTPVSTEDVLGEPAVTEPAPTESELAKPMETNESWIKVPGAYPATPEELVLPWVRSSETVVSEPAVPQPTPVVSEKVLEESSSNKVKSVGNNVNFAGEDEECSDPWAFRPQQHRRVGGLSHLERILANAPGVEADSDIQYGERGIGTPRLASVLSEGIDSRAGESPEKKADISAHAALPIAEKQWRSLEGSMATSYGSSLPEARPTLSPAVNASNEYDVRSLGSALLNSMGPGVRFAGLVIIALVTVYCAFVFSGRPIDTFAKVMAGPDRLLEELRNNHGFDISVLSQMIYELVRWLAGDRALPG
jgi:hypothetical protein